MNAQDLYHEARQHMLAEGDALKASFFFFSPLNIVPKLALDKVAIERVGSGYALVSPDGTARVLPTGTPKDFYGNTLAALTRYKTLALVPEHIANHLAAGYEKKLQQKEYLMATASIASHDGPQLSRTRKYLRAAQRRTIVETFDPSKLAEYLALNTLWYRQVADLKFRTYFKTTLDWTLQNWEALLFKYPDIVTIGIRDRETGKLLSFNMACLLTDSLWTAYIERYDRDAPFRSANTVGFAALAEMFSQPFQNDGTADTKPIRELKERYEHKIVSAYTIGRRK